MGRRAQRAYIPLCRPRFPLVPEALTRCSLAEIHTDQKPAVVLAYHEITDGDVSVKEASFQRWLAQ
jgi:hypothetical protein